jgi:hypothetical protein
MSPGQFIEHEPAPRGSPHDPQGDGEAERNAVEPPPVLTAKVDSSRASAWLPHVGHAGVSAPRNSASNRCSQPSQRYS